MDASHFLEAWPAESEEVYLCLITAASYLAVVLKGKVKGKAADTLSFGAGRNLQALDDARVALVLKARVLTLCVFTNDGKVDIAMTGRESREGLAKNDRSINIKLLAHGDVPWNVAGLGDGSEKDT
jgi:hypothetical protein